MPANSAIMSLVYRYRGFNCRKKQFSRSYRNNLNSAWKKINAACLPFITNVCCYFSRRLSRSAKCEHGDAIQHILRYGLGEGEGGKEGGQEMGGEAGYNHCCGYAIFFFVSRNAFFFTVRVLFNCKRISILYKSMS